MKIMRINEIGIVLYGGVNRARQINFFRALHDLIATRRRHTERCCGVWSLIYECPEYSVCE
jgi:hypothetical protein